MKIKKLAVLFASVALAASLVTGCSAGQKETAAEAAGTAGETGGPGEGGHMVSRYGG